VKVSNIYKQTKNLHDSKTMNPPVNKTLEYSLELTIALSATLLQIQFQQFNLDALYLKLAILSGSCTYVFRALKDDNLSNKDAFFTALIGYTFGLYIAPAIDTYYNLKLPAIIGAVHYISGVMGMWVLNVGWSVMKGASKDGWTIIKGFFSKWTNKNGSDQP
jgi:hypothetical protein